MKKPYAYTSALIILAVILLCSLTVPLKAGDKPETKVISLRFVPDGSNYLAAFKKKVKYIDISFSVIVNCKYTRHFTETNETETTDQLETVIAGGEATPSLLERNGLNTKTLECTGNKFILKYVSPKSYTSSAGEYYLEGEVSADGKEISSINVKFAGQEGSESWSYNVFAVHIPWVGSLGKAFDKTKRNYGFNYGQNGKPIQSVVWEKNTGTETWKYKYTAESIVPERRQSFDIYFTFE